MAPEESITAPTIFNEGNNYFWCNWQHITSTPHADTFMPPSVDATSLDTAGNYSKRVSSTSANGWLLPYPAASPPSHHDADGAISPTCFLHNTIEWNHPFLGYGEIDGGTRAEPADASQLEDFLGGHRRSPSARSAIPMADQVSALGAAGHCSLYREQGVVAAAMGKGMSSGNSSSEADSKSDNGKRLALSGQLPDVAPEIGLTCTVPQSGAGAREKPLARAMAGSGQRSSSYRGVTRHRWTGRYEAHLWDNTCVREGIKRKGRQVYLGGYDREDKAARAYDLAALKYWGPTAATNFPASNYVQEIEDMKHMTRQEYISSLRRKSTGFSRGASVYRGVTRHHQHGRWQARIGRVAGNKDLYLGTFTTEEEAAEAYDIAAIKFRGVNAVTNFELTRYDIEAIVNTSLPIGSSCKRLKLSPQANSQGQHAMIIAESLPAPSMATCFFPSLLQISSSGSSTTSPYGCSTTGLACSSTGLAVHPSG